MILIISRGSHELTTELVADWIVRLGGSVVRVNAEDLWPGTASSIEIGSARDRVTLFTPGVDEEPVQIDPAEVGAVWYRRWTYFRHYLDLADPLLGSPTPLTSEAFMARRAALAELRAAGRALMSVFEHARWLSDPETTDLDKIRAIRMARASGLDVPATLVTTSRERVLEFAAEHEAGVITKNIAPAPLSIDLPDGSALATYTALVDEGSAATWPETFTPSLFQERVPKAYEVRVFVLGERLWSMAIFSQDHEDTELDFRRYQYERPNRYVPYRLDDEIAAKVLHTMRALDLETGSVDLVVTPDGRTVFLEINPVGQFGMISHPCNYALERHVARYLMDRDTRAA